MVDTTLKESILAAILADIPRFEGWDGTFSDLHAFCDANVYLMPVWDAVAGNLEDRLAACNEVLDFLEERFASLRNKGKISS